MTPPVAPARPDAKAEDGLILVWLSTMLVVLLTFAGFAVDVGHWYLEASRVQKAADSAALGGVVYIPGAFARAETEARDLAARHGYSAPDDVEVEIGGRPNQLRVTITTEVRNFFVGVIGFRTQSLTRSAVAEFEGPVPMGSPSNNLGNQPVGPGDEEWGSGITDPAATDPQVWANIAGFGTNKHNGDRFTAGRCDNPGLGVYNCAGSNTDYAPDGYFYAVRVRADAADLSKRLAIEIYDPAFVQSGDSCDNLDGGQGTAADETNIRNAMAALGERYDPVNGTYNRKYCPGDHYVTSQGGPFPTTTFTVRRPDLTPWIDTDNPVVGTGSCAPRAYPPFRGAATGANTLAAQLADTTSYARSVYHRFVRVCEVGLNEAGVTTAGQHDFLLQVETGAGSGHNRYSIRAGLVSVPGHPDADGSKVSLFANGRMPLYANQIGANTQFFLARVLPGGGSRTLAVKFYDVGDAAAAGSITLIPPAGNTFNGCRVTIMPSGGTASTSNGGCTINNVSSASYQAQLVEMSIPIPASWSCNQNVQTDCWVKVRFNYPAGTSDTTTWAAGIVGDPVRLVE